MGYEDGRGLEDDCNSVKMLVNVQKLYVMEFLMLKPGKLVLAIMDREAHYTLGGHCQPSERPESYPVLAIHFFSYRFINKC